MTDILSATIALVLYSGAFLTAVIVTVELLVVVGTGVTVWRWR